MKIKIPEYIKSGADKYKYILLICAVGILLMVIPTASDAKESDTLSAQALSESTEDIERKAEKIFSKIDGVGKVNVKISVKSGYETVYVYDTDKNISQNGESYSGQAKNELVTVNNSGSQKPIVSKIKYPEYLGAVIVCEGGDNSKVKLELTQAMKSLTGISAENIVVAKMK